MVACQVVCHPSHIGFIGCPVPLESLLAKLRPTPRWTGHSYSAEHGYALQPLLQQQLPLPIPHYEVNFVSACTKSCFRLHQAVPLLPHLHGGVKPGVLAAPNMGMCRSLCCRFSCSFLLLLGWRVGPTPARITSSGPQILLFLMSDAYGSGRAHLIN